MSTVLNAANEVAVQAFLGGAVGFTDIAGIIGSNTCGTVSGASPSRWTRCWSLDREARELAGEETMRRRRGRRPTAKQPMTAIPDLRSVVHRRHRESW